MEPTQSQLDARMNPTPATIYTPMDGIFRSSSGSGGIYMKSGGTLQFYDIGELGKQAMLAENSAKDQYGNYVAFNGANNGVFWDRGIQVLKNQYGFDYNALPSVNLGDFFQQNRQLGRDTPDGWQPNITNSTNINDFIKVAPSSLQQMTINGAPLTPEQQAGVKAGTGYTTPEPPAITNIGNPIPAQSINTTLTTPQLPTPQAPSYAETYQASLTGQIESLKTQIETEAAKRAADYQKQIDDLKTQQSDFQNKMDAGLTGIDTATQKSLADKEAALALEKQRFDENYNANQSLISELDGLLTTGNQLIEEMKGTTGLASIMNPRIAKTMSDVQARSGVIQAVLSARNGQMSYAQQQLGTTYDALSSMLTDQTNYYKTVITFYDSQKKDASDQVLSLTKNQKDYLDVKINMLNNDLTKLQASKDIISKAMLDPDTATAYGNAGVTLNDSPEIIGKKLAQYAYSQELVNTSNKMTTAGYTSTPIAGVTPTIVTDSQGNQKAWYKKGANTELSPGATLVDSNGKIITTAPTAAQITAGGYTQADIDQLNANRVAAAKLGIDIPKTWPDSPTSNGTTGGTTTTLSGLQGGKTFVSGNLQFDPQSYQTSLNALLSSRGGDGFVDPAVYLRGYNAFINAGGLKSDYLQIFPINDYINPANTWPEIIALGGGTKPKATSTRSS